MCPSADLEVVQGSCSSGIHLGLVPCRKNRRHLRRVREQEYPSGLEWILTGNLAIRK